MIVYIRRWTVEPRDQEAESYSNQEEARTPTNWSKAYRSWTFSLSSLLFDRNWSLPYSDEALHKTKKKPNPITPKRPRGRPPKIPIVKEEKKEKNKGSRDRKLTDGEIFEFNLQLRSQYSPVKTRLRKGRSRLPQVIRHRVCRLDFFSKNCCITFAWILIGGNWYQFCFSKLFYIL